MNVNLGSTHVIGLGTFKLAGDRSRCSSTCREELVKKKINYSYGEVICVKSKCEERVKVSVRCG